MYSYPDEILTKALESVPRFDSAEQEELSQRLVDALSEEDLEVAARTSYAYWYASKNITQNDYCLSPTIRNNMAMKEARRHLVGGKGDFHLALTTLQSSLEHRKEYNIDVLRLCFVKDIDLSDDEEEICKRYRELIENELPKQLIVVRGKDKGSRPIVVLMSRQEDKSSFDFEAFMLTRLYVVERAIAAVELVSAGQEEKLTAFFHAGDYVRAHAPPIAAIKEVVTVLQQNYPERLKTFVYLDPPFWIRSLYSVLRFFLDDEVNNKLFMVAGEANKERIVSEIVSRDEAMPFMIPNGERSSPIDPVYYLHQVPFFCPYDECQWQKDASSSNSIPHPA